MEGEQLKGQVDVLAEMWVEQVGVALVQSFITRVVSEKI